MRKIIFTKKKGIKELDEEHDLKSRIQEEFGRLEKAFEEQKNKLGATGLNTIMGSFERNALENAEIFVQVSPSITKKIKEFGLEPFMSPYVTLPKKSIGPIWYRCLNNSEKHDNGFRFSYGCLRGKGIVVSGVYSLNNAQAYALLEEESRIENEGLLEKNLEILSDYMDRVYV